jgi:hypothetical protein
MEVRLSVGLFGRSEKTRETDEEFLSVGYVSKRQIAPTWAYIDKGEIIPRGNIDTGGILSWQTVSSGGNGKTLWMSLGIAG